MSEPEFVTGAAGGALVELLEVSPQVDAAVLLDRAGGRLLASEPPAAGGSVASRLGATSMKLLAAAEQARVELGREPIAQVEVATPDGHVFVVADATHVVAAVTDADPTVGLVFYDLKTALRAVREARPGDGSSSVVVSIGETSTTSAGDGGSSNGAAPASSGGRRWRKGKS